MKDIVYLKEFLWNSDSDIQIKNVKALDIHNDPNVVLLKESLWDDSEINNDEIEDSHAKLKDTFNENVAETVTNKFIESDEYKKMFALRDEEGAYGLSLTKRTAGTYDYENLILLDDNTLKNSGPYISKINAVSLEGFIFDITKQLLSVYSGQADSVNYEITWHIEPNWDLVIGNNIYEFIYSLIDEYELNVFKDRLVPKLFLMPLCDKILKTIVKMKIMTPEEARQVWSKTKYNIKLKFDSTEKDLLDYSVWWGCYEPVRSYQLRGYEIVSDDNNLALFNKMMSTKQIDFTSLKGPQTREADNSLSTIEFTDWNSFTSYKYFIDDLKRWCDFYIETISTILKQMNLPNQTINLVFSKKLLFYFDEENEPNVLEDIVEQANDYCEKKFSYVDVIAYTEDDFYTEDWV